MVDLDSIINIEGLLPPFLQDSGEEILNHRKQAVQLLTYLHHQYTQIESYCETALSLEGNNLRHPAEYTQYRLLLKKLQKECDTAESKALKLDELVTGSENELHSLRQQNQQIQEECFQLSQDITKLSAQEEHLLKQREEDIKSMLALKETYDGAKNKYKKLLLCHIRLLDQCNNLGGHANAGHEETLAFSYLKDDLKTLLLKVELNRSNNNWKMLDVQPFVPDAVRAQKNLQETNNIRNLICFLREEALKLA